MKREPVESSMIAAIGYNPDNQTLEVEFNDGNVYEYDDVEPEVYEEFMAADSHGRFFLANIRDNYPYRKLSMGGRRG